MFFEIYSSTPFHFTNTEAAKSILKLNVYDCQRLETITEELDLCSSPLKSVKMKLYLLPQKAAVMDCCQISVMDLDELVQVLGFLYLVLKLQSGTVQNLARHDANKFTTSCK